MINNCLYLFFIIGLFVEIYDKIAVQIIVTLVYFILYPITNSIVYGLTNSTKKFMYALCLRDETYDENEELENQLRNENLLAPRVYADLITSS
jgi:hypothetical protein